MVKEISNILLANMVVEGQSFFRCSKRRVRAVIILPDFYLVILQQTFNSKRKLCASVVGCTVFNKSKTGTEDISFFMWRQFNRFRLTLKVRIRAAITVPICPDEKNVWVDFKFNRKILEEIKITNSSGPVIQEKPHGDVLSSNDYRLQ